MLKIDSQEFFTSFVVYRITIVKPLRRTKDNIYDNDILTFRPTHDITKGEYYIKFSFGLRIYNRYIDNILSKTYIILYSQLRQIIDQHDIFIEDSSIDDFFAEFFKKVVIKFQLDKHTQLKKYKGISKIFNNELYQSLLKSSRERINKIIECIRYNPSTLFNETKQIKLVRHNEKIDHVSLEENVKDSEEINQNEFNQNENELIDL